MTWTYRQPVKIEFGQGVLSRLPAVLEGLGISRALLVTSPSFVKRGLVGSLLDDCRGALCGVYSDVSPNPDVAQCDVCSAMLRDLSCDGVVALGGGSVIDCAKAASVFSLSGRPASDYLATGESIPARHLPLVAVPTTSGTGSEVTSVSVLSDHARGIKAPMAADSFFPAVALVDPDLTLTVPPRMTAVTGFDALCHAVEAYWSRNHQPVCDALAVEAARTLLANIAAAVARPGDIGARCAMSQGSLMAGLAFALPKTSAPHACSYPLTNMLGIPHGEACALTLDWFIRLNAARGDRRTAELATLLGFASPDALADEIVRLKKLTGLRTDLRDLALGDDAVERLACASRHPNLANNPMDVSLDDLRRMYAGLAM